MATTGNGIRESFVAAVDLSSYQWHFVKAGSVSGEVNVSTGGSDPYPLGILENDPTAGQEAIVCLFGLSKVSASARASGTGAAACAIAMGGNIVSSSLGLGVKGAASAINAIALETVTSGTGGVIRVFVLSPGATIVGSNVV